MATQSLEWGGDGVGLGVGLGGGLGVGLRALMEHMSSANEQSERTAAYATLQRVIGLWKRESRLELIGDLLKW